MPMSQYFTGQIMMGGYAFAPKSFAYCDGRLMPLSQYQALFSLLGIQYGGNGTTTFGLPDLRSRVPVAYGKSVDGSWNPTPMQIGASGGAESVTLTAAQLPAHSHVLQASTSTGAAKNPSGAVIGSIGTPLYGDGTTNPVMLNGQTCAAAGGSQPHPNMQPYAVINFCIALAGIFPSRN
jgi:microcystin-dependent protein